MRKLPNRRIKGLPVPSVIESLECRRLFASGINFTEFPQIGMGTNFVQDLTAGPDGNVYFSSGLANNVDSITPTGVVKVYDTTSVGSNAPSGIAAGTDGNIYFNASNNFGKLTLATGTVSNIPLSSALDTAGLMTLGPDGNFWTDCFFSVIEQITPSGQVTNFNYSGSGSGQIVSFNGQLYFASGTDIRAVTTSGNFDGAFPTPSGGTVENIAVGPDGNLWFTEQLTTNSTTTNFFGYLTPGGTITEFPSSIGPVSGIAAGSDGNIYYRAADYLVGVNTSGTQIALQNLGGGNNTDGKELISSNGDLWYNESFADQIGVAIPVGSTSPTPTPTPTPTPSPTPTPTPTPTPAPTTPPTAVLASAPAFTAGSAPNYYFNVSYTDSAGVALSRPTINNNNVTVLGPQGAVLPVTLGAITIADDQDITATYQIKAPPYSGTYYIIMVGNSVSDVDGNTVASEDLGTFTVTGGPSTPTPTPTPTPTGPQPVLVSSLPGTLPGAVTEGAKGSVALQLTNSGTAVQNGPVTISLYASPTPSLIGDADLVLPAKAHQVKLGIGATRVLVLRFRYPVSVPQGEYYLLAEVSTATSGPSVVSTGKSVLLANPFIDLVAGFAVHPSVTFAANGNGTAYVTVTNLGNVTAHGQLQIGLAAVPTDGSPDVPLFTYSRMPKLYAGQEKLFIIHFRFPPTLSDGTYQFMATVDPGTTFADPYSFPTPTTATDPTAFIYG